MNKELEGEISKETAELEDILPGKGFGEEPETGEESLKFSFAPAPNG